jgi:hypothetical protein
MHVRSQAHAVRIYTTQLILINVVDRNLIQSNSVKLAKVHHTFANYRNSRSLLTKVQWIFANWRNYRGYIGESALDFRQLVKFYRVYWKKSTELSPLTKVLLAKFRNLHKTTTI